MNVAFKMMNFVFKMTNFVFKMTDLELRADLDQKSGGGGEVRLLVKPSWAGPEKWFEWQLRMYWLSAVLMLGHYGSDLC